MPSIVNSAPTPRDNTRAREGKRGRLINPAWPASNPEHRRFGRTTPGPDTTLEPDPHERHQPPRPPLDNKEEIDRAHGDTTSCDAGHEAGNRRPVARRTSFRNGCSP